LLEPLPIDEAGPDRSIGYDGRDFFSPEMAFGAPDADLTSHVQKVNALFAAKNKPGVGETDLIGSMAQLKVMIDIFHLYGIAVILDVVYNHAGPFSGDDNCLYFFDLRAPRVRRTRTTTTVYTLPTRVWPAVSRLPIGTRTFASS
jgi:1,4-alpha-glucan branching enzyme